MLVILPRIRDTFCAFVRILLCTARGLKGRTELTDFFA